MSDKLCLDGLTKDELKGMLSDTKDRIKSIGTQLKNYVIDLESGDPPDKAWRISATLAMHHLKTEKHLINKASSRLKLKVK